MKTVNDILALETLKDLLSLSEKLRAKKKLTPDMIQIILGRKKQFIKRWKVLYKLKENYNYWLQQNRYKIKT